MKPQLCLARALTLAAALFGQLPLAHANGAFPAVSQVTVEPGNPNHFAMRSNFGVVVTRDAGATWDWICEGAIGYMNTEPSIALLAGGRMLVGLPDGLKIGVVDGCNFEVVPNVSGLVADVSAIPNGAVAIVTGVGQSSTRVFQSADAGASFQQLGAALENFVGLTVDAAKSNPKRMYLSGMAGADASQGALAVSDDGGQNFAVHAIEGSDSTAQPYIAAINPIDPDTVYVRLTGGPGRLLVTHDAGAHFAQVLSLDGQLQGLAVSPDGKTVIASSPYVGMFRADAATLSFHQLSCGGVSCLNWSDAGLLGCGTASWNGFMLGRSTDVGESFETVLHPLCIRGPIACASDSPVGSVCEGVWPGVADQLGQHAAGAVCDPHAASKPFMSCGSGGDGTSGGSQANGGARANGGSQANGGATNSGGAVQQAGGATSAGRSAAGGAAGKAGLGGSDSPAGGETASNASAHGCTCGVAPIGRGAPSAFTGLGGLILATARARKRVSHRSQRRPF